MGALAFVLALGLSFLGVLVYSKRHAPAERVVAPRDAPAAPVMKLVGDTDWSLLTEREKQVARRVSAGESNKQVAQALGIRPDTVSAHLKRIYQKMNVQSRIQLAARLRDVDD